MFPPMGIPDPLRFRADRHLMAGARQDLTRVALIAGIVWHIDDVV